MKNKGKPKHRSMVGNLAHAVHDDLIKDFQTTLEAIDPTASDFRVQYLKKEFLTKLCIQDKAKSSERQFLAIKKWQKMEERNRKSNIRLMVDSADFGWATSDDLIEFARKVVVDIIGTDVPEDIFSSCMFTGGASTRVKRGPTAIAQKFVGKADVTIDAWPYARDLVLGSDLWTSQFGEDFLPNFVPGSVLFTVPKNSDIDRVAAKEPELNMYLQRGVGNHFRSCLLKKGINLNDQSRNQKLAKYGSSSGNLATLDLSSASDLISNQLVCRLLPTSWFVLLDSIRSKRTLYGEDEYELHMFSSMGNGFTFELETLLFFALACAINYHLGVRGTVSVYGDDIIVPVRAAPVYGVVFSFFGFILNLKKSFWRGGFRESCGKHWFYGADVTPFYVREPIHHQSRLIHFLNQLRKWCEHPFGDILDDDFFAFVSKWSKLVDKRFYGGQDVDRIDSLVTGHSPRMLLVRAKVKAKVPEVGAYLHWLRGRDLTEYPLETSEASSEAGWVVRRNHSWERDLPLYLYEINGVRSHNLQ